MNRNELKQLIKVIIRESMESDKVCSICNGSGEGRVPGSKCYSCHGSGAVGYKPELSKHTDSDYDWDGEREERNLGLDEGEEADVVNDMWADEESEHYGSNPSPKKSEKKVDESKISPREKKIMSQTFSKMGLDGNKRFESVSKGLHAVTSVLHAMGFNLDMVSGDMIMGQKGQRNLTFRRSNDEGADPFTEKPEIKNSRIAFVWENLSNEGQTPRYEILAYPS